jgi:hypothetical protein
MGAISGDYAWPALTFASDGEFISLRLRAETRADVSAIRYLREVALDIPAAHFEQAVEAFLDTVEGRVLARLPDERELSGLREELRNERADIVQARACKLQALAGFDPGSATLPSNTLAHWLDTRLPLSPSWTGPRQLLGGYRNDSTRRRTALLVRSHREDSQRFYLARLIGAAVVSSPDQHVLPVSDAATALQKLERSFAQELLCPWHDLDAFTNDSGTDAGGIAEAAEHFMVSELLVESTLVNKGKLPRTRLSE